jgi:hypothetical protein
MRQSTNTSIRELVNSSTRQPAAAPLVALLANVLGRDFLTYMDPFSGRPLYEVAHAATRRAMDQET